MSKIYDALTKLEHHRRPRARNARPRSWNPSQTGLMGVWCNEISLEGRIIATLAGTMLILGILLVALMNQLVGRALRSQIDQRALIMATNLSDAAAGHVIGGNILELHVLVTKYARLDGSAYAFITDNKGRVIAHTLATLPPELARNANPSAPRQVNRRIVRLDDKMVYETRMPILEGQAGAAHIGVWRESVTAEVYRALLPIVAPISALLFAGIGFSVLIARRLIPWLSDMAGKMSTRPPDSSLENAPME
jgi:hypothetical protein